MDRKHSFAGSIVSSSLSFLLLLGLHTPHSHLSYLVKLLYLGGKIKTETNNTGQSSNLGSFFSIRLPQISPH